MYKTFRKKKRLKKMNNYRSDCLNMMQTLPGESVAGGAYGQDVKS